MEIDMENILKKMVIFIMTYSLMANRRYALELLLFIKNVSNLSVNMDIIMGGLSRGNTIRVKLLFLQLVILWK